MGTRTYLLGGWQPAYAQGLAPESLMVFAPPVGVLDRVRTLEAIRNAPRWKRVVFAAECDGRSAPYRAQCSSAYVSIGGNGGWP